MPPFQQTNTTHYETVIIGAGIAGLACAARLHKHRQNASSFTVLEARNRVGGRIESVWVDGNRLDTGANWVHGAGDEQKRNPILEFVPKEHFRNLKSGVTFQDSEAKHGSGQGATGDSSQDLVMPPDISSEMFRNLFQLMQSLSERAEQMSLEEARDTPILSGIIQDRDFKHAWGELPEKYRASFAGLPQILEGMEAAPLNDQSAEDRDSTPGMSLLEYVTDGYEGEQVFLLDGYSSVIQNLAGEVIADGHVKLGSEVLQIHWDQAPIVIITGSETYTARNVVCTLPLGVLKDQLHPDAGKSIFSPPLSAEKHEAITSLGYGTLDKVFMIYDHTWWKDEPYVSIVKKGLSSFDPTRSTSELTEPDTFRGFTHELPGLSVSPEGAKFGACGLLLINLHALTGVPALAAFVSCANARHIEVLSDEDASSVVHRTLTTWFGHSPPPPRSVHVTRWAQDRFSRGSYSHMITGRSERRHREAFHTPIVSAAGSQLRFAGEHTSVDDFATAHGALLSGWREADALIDAGRV